MQNIQNRYRKRTTTNFRLCKCFGYGKLMFGKMFGKMSLCFFVDDNETTELYNIFLSFIAFGINKYNIYFKIENLEETNQSLRMSIKENTLSYC